MITTFLIGFASGIAGMCIGIGFVELVRWRDRKGEDDE